MSILKYFKRESKLPNPAGPLSKVVPSEGIKAANKEVASCMNLTPEEVPSASVSATSRGTYERFTADEKAQIAKRASEHGVAATARYCSKRYHGRMVKESSVRTWRNKYLSELKLKAREGKSAVVEKLVDKKRGHPFLLGEALDKQVQAYLLDLREGATVVNTAIAIGCAQGLVQHYDSNLLECNGGPILLTKSWVKSLLQRMGFVKRRACSKGKVSVENFQVRKEQFLFDVKVIIEMEDISTDLVINWDQTGIHYVPVSNYTMEKEGSKRIELVGIEDKRQITAVFSGTMSGVFLPMQLIYQGKTPKCLPSVQFPSNWNVTFTDNHWSNETTMLAYLEKILFPYIISTREKLGLEHNQPALVIFDRFRAQCTDRILSLLEDHHVHVAIVPANCTNRLQPLDVSVNKAAKDFLRRKFQNWYADQVSLQIHQRQEEDKTLEPVDLRMNIVKPLGAKWIISLFEYLSAKPEIIKNGFRESGLC